MKIGKTKLKMSSGEIRHFGSEGKRNRFERVAQAVKHGWKPPAHHSAPVHEKFSNPDRY